MPLPKSVTKIDRQGGVTYTSNVDRVNYTIEELSRRALFDTAKYIRKIMVTELKTLPGLKRSRRVYRSAQYWVRRRETDLQIGFKHDSWYGSRSELGTHGSPARNILRDAVYNNIGQIRQIQGQYLSAIQDEGRALGMIDEGEYKSPDGED